MEYTGTEKRMVLLASCVAILVNPMAGSMLNLALGNIQADFLCSEHELGWISSIYFIVSVMVLLPASKLADIYGKKKCFLFGAVIGALGLILSAISQNIYQLYVFRGVTAIGMAFISCVSVAMISDVYDPHERGLALGINTACVYIGASIGPTFGGVLTDMFGWRSIFYVLTPLLIIAFLALTGFHYNIKTSPDAKFDSTGSALCALAVMLTMFGLINLPQIYAFVLIVAGLAVAYVFIRYERKPSSPIFRGYLFRDSRFSKSILALFLNYAASYCVSFFLSRYLQGIGAMTPTEAGMLLMVQPVVQVIFTLIAGKLTDRMDKRILPTMGLIILGSGLVLLLFMDTTVNVPLLVVSMLIMGTGYGLFSAPNTSAVMSYVSAKEYSSASGLMAMFRQMGMMLSMGLATCLISIFLGTDTILAPDNYSAFMDAIRVAWVVCIAFSVIGAVASWSRGSSVDCNNS